MGLFNKSSYKSITTDEAKTALNTDKNIILLDVRTPAEYRQGHIPNSTLIPVDEFQKALNELKNKDAKIFVYCRSGARSATASKMLANWGYTDVSNVLGGISAWKYEIE